MLRKVGVMMCNQPRESLFTLNPGVLYDDNLSIYRSFFKSIKKEQQDASITFKIFTLFPKCLKATAQQRHHINHDTLSSHITHRDLIEKKILEDHTLYTTHHLQPAMHCLLPSTK